MDCNCININANGEGQLPEIRHVYGNVLRLGIPLTLRTIEMVNGKPKATDSDFIPSSNYPVNVIFSKAAVQITQISIEATMRDDNVACIEDRGTIPVGTYDITVACNDDSGNPYRFKQLASLKVVDTTAEAGIEKGIEYEVETWYLRAAIFLVLKGDAGETVQAQSDWEETDIGNPAFIKNKPNIPEAQVNADWNAITGAAQILNKPSIPADLGDLTNNAGYTKNAGTVTGVKMNNGSAATPDTNGLVDLGTVLTAHQDISGKVDKETGKGLSSEDYTSNEKSKLAGIAPGAEVNVQADWKQTNTNADDYIKNKPTIPDVSNLATKSELQGKANASDVYTKVEVDSALDLKEDTIDDLSTIRSGAAAGATAYQKPASGIPASHLADDVIPDVSGFATLSDVADAVADLVDSAPETLDTLNELAAALGDDPNFATTITTALAGKVDKESGKGLSTEDYTSAEKNKLAGLSNYDDTSLSGRVSALENAGYINSETDPTVPAWAKAPTKPTYTPGEIGALPSDTEIPTKTSDLTNDSGFINKVFYSGVCSTAAASMPKVCTVDTFQTTTSGGVTHAKDGTIIAVTFANSDTNTTDAPTLNVNGIGAKGIYYSNALETSTAKNTIVAGTKNVMAYYYYDSSLDNGNGAWVYLGKSTDSNTTYSAMTQAEVTAGTSTTGRLLAPKLLRDNFYTEDEVDALLDDKADTVKLADVATSGSYNDLSDTPTIPDELADLASDSSHRTVTDTEKSSWNGKADAISVVNVSTTGSVSQTIDPNKFYKFGSIDSLALSLTAGTGFIVYAGKFTASANWGGTKLSVPANVTEASGNDTVEAGKMYEFSIMDDIIIVKEVG